MCECMFMYLLDLLHLCVVKCFTLMNVARGGYLFLDGTTDHFPNPVAGGEVSASGLPDGMAESA